MIKSLVSFPSVPNLWQNKPLTASATSNARLVTCYELYKLISKLEGSIVKCGITNDEGFAYFNFFRQITQNEIRPLIAFEKDSSIFEFVEEKNEKMLAVRDRIKSETESQRRLMQKGKMEQVDYVPGSLSESIPEYLIANPELKIALLNIDLDDYENTLTTMQYFYPRLVSGGVLAINNYCKNTGEALAMKEYFSDEDILIHCFPFASSPYYIIKG
jgi:hypothetical protein